MFSLFTFRVKPEGSNPDEATRLLLEKINADGRIYLTQTKHEGKFVIRMTIGQFETRERDVKLAVDVIRELASSL